MRVNRKPSTLFEAMSVIGLAILLAPLAHARVTQDFHKTIALAANGRISLDNLNGDVKITGWDRNEVQIDAVKQARDQQRLDEIRIEVQTSSDSVEIATRYPSHMINTDPGSVEYMLHVPKNARLDKVHLTNGSLDVSGVHGEIVADLMNGKLRASNLAGRAELSTVNGSIEADYQSLSNVSDIRLKSVNGAVELGLPISPNADVEASSVNGGIRTEFPLEVSGGFMHKNLSGKLGNGGTRIELSNVNGSIHIAQEHGNL